VAAEKLNVFAALHADASLRPAITALSLEQKPESAEAAMAEIVRGWLESTGPQNVAAFAERFAVSSGLVESALAMLEHEGQVLRGNFTQNPGGQIEWCNRRVLARIHRLTLGRLRREIEPVSSAQHEDFLQRWQHLARGTQLHGVDGTLQVIKQLQGLEFPAQDWERRVLATRVSRYRPEYLDKLCASGEVMWGRISAHPAFEESSAARSRRIRPTRVAPIALFLRENADWLLHEHGDSTNALSPAALDVYKALQDNGASFFLQLVNATRRLASEVEDALWELVAAGLVTADGFDNLRALIDPKRRLALGRTNRSRPRNAPGRWALLPLQKEPPDNAAFARQLIARWGIVSRDIARRETVVPPWRDLLVALRRLEAQGEIRGGRFVSSQIGEQFASAEAIELLRMVRRLSLSDSPAQEVSAAS
jgi:ATP-dependent Lhr-like helicase